MDHWLLLGICWWPSFGTWLPSTLLVCFNPFLLWFGVEVFSGLRILPVALQFLVCRLCIIFLGFDVFFVVFCVALACVIGIAVCCCLPCIIAILYAVADQVAVITCNFIMDLRTLYCSCFHSTFLRLALCVQCASNLISCQVLFLQVFTVRYSYENASLTVCIKHGYLQFG